VLTGANAIMKDGGKELADVTLGDLGTANKVQIDSNSTTVVEGAGKKSEVKNRASQIRHEIESTTSDYDREKLEERLAKLVGGIAQVSVGGATEAEVKERKHRYEDAKHATTAAIESGILAGGGAALLRAGAKLKKDGLGFEGDKLTGLEILIKALEQPVRVIAENSGLDGAVVARRILRDKKASYGFNALTEEYGDMFDMGIVDPTKVTLTALENAVSVASTLMMTECLIVEAPAEDDDAAAMEGGHDH
jgi:chaperonin GroEL